MHVLGHLSADLCWRTEHLFLSMEDLLKNQAGLTVEGCVDWYEIGLCPEGSWGITKELKVGSKFIHSFTQAFIHATNIYILVLRVMI